MHDQPCLTASHCYIKDNEQNTLYKKQTGKIRQVNIERSLRVGTLRAKRLKNIFMNKKFIKKKFMLNDFIKNATKN